MESFLHCPTFFGDSILEIVAESISLTTSCFFVAAFFYMLWWLQYNLLIPLTTGSVMFSICIGIKIAMGHTISPSIHVSMAILYGMYFITELYTFTFGEEEDCILPISTGPPLPPLPPLKEAIERGRAEKIIRTLAIVIYMGLIMWSRLYLQANTPNEVLVGTMIGILFFTIQHKITPILNRSNNSGKTLLEKLE